MIDFFSRLFRLIQFKIEQNPTLRIFFSKKNLICIFIGFASGLPLYLLLQLFPVWFKSEGINIKTISLFTLAQLPYTLKFIWAPFLDRFTFFNFGRRKGAILVTQIVLFTIIFNLGFLKPSLNIQLIAFLALLIGFFSATADISFDAYRRELLNDGELVIGNSSYVNAYRIAGLVPGALSLILSEHIPWENVFNITALFMIPSIILPFFIKEPQTFIPKIKSFHENFSLPFFDFFETHGLKMCRFILAFILFYKLGDSMATALATPFYMEMGFSRNDIGLIAKNAGLWPSVFGTLIGGIIMTKIGLNRSLWFFGFVQLISILGFMGLSVLGPFENPNSSDKILLAGVISFEAIGVGLGNVAFVSFIAKSTSRLYAAAQLALLTSFSAIPRSIINASTGFIVDVFGWTNFFWICFFLGFPGMILLCYIAPWNQYKEESTIKK